RYIPTSSSARAESTLGTPSSERREELEPHLVASAWWDSGYQELTVAEEQCNTEHNGEENGMPRMALSRRNLLEAGDCALAGTASAHAWIGSSTANEEIVRQYYAAWEKKDWSPFDILLAENFTFTSANNDDHISKSAFKARCWESQIDFIERF